MTIAKRPNVHSEPNDIEERLRLRWVSDRAAGLSRLVTWPS